mgnify:CR=1 FL=1
MSDHELVRQQYERPSIVDAADPDVRAYIERLEQGLIDAHDIRERLHKAVDEAWLRALGIEPETV